MSSPDQIRDQMKEIVSSQTDASARLAAFGTLVKSLVDASDVTAGRMRGMVRNVAHLLPICNFSKAMSNSGFFGISDFLRFGRICLS